MWYQEVEYYDFSNPGFKDSTGHFTCLVWKDSKKYGLGISISDKTVVVCFNTSPPGNVIGEFEQNVLPKLADSTMPSPTPIPSPESPSPPSSPSPPPSEYEPAHQDSMHSRKIVTIVTMLYKVMDELKKRNSNKQMIISYVQKIILHLLT